ncbi:hypothetical protein [Moraxella oculi]|uniref:Phage head morphogenesis protein n=1 Tax=Moraxella oculi TaxID=2940516 RepID=A0ABW8U5F2_9GAMM
MKRLINLERLKQSLVNEFGITLKSVDEYLQKAIFNRELKSLNQREIKQLTTNADKELQGLFGAYVDGLKANWRTLFSHRYKVHGDEAYKATRQRLNSPKSLMAYADKVFDKPLHLTTNVGISLDELTKSFGKTESERIIRAIRLAHSEGLTNDKLVQLIRGSRANRYQDGILRTTTRNAHAIARTGTAIVASEAKQAFINDNKDIIKGIKVIATLDSRTSPICRHLDHQFMPTHKAKYPPYHFNCRSSFEIIYDGYITPKQRTSEHGVVENQTYYEWLKKQTPDYQDEVLGKTRGKLFRDGGMSAEKFKSLQLDKNFTPLTLEQMRQIEPAGFERAFKTAMPLNDGSLQETMGRFAKAVKNLNRENSMTFRKQHAIGQKWTVANIGDDIKRQLNAKTDEVWLSDDTLIKMMIHHPELDLLPLFKDVQSILDSAIKIVQKDDLNVIYFTKQGKNYITAIKATRDKSELYLTTIYQIDDKRFEKELRKIEKDH